MKPYVSREHFDRAFEPVAPYPLTTGQAAVELRCRNIDANHDRLSKLAELGKVNVERSGDDWIWPADAIDAAAEILCDFGFLTPRGGFCEFVAISGDQEAEARAAAIRTAGDEHEDNYGIVIAPVGPDGVRLIRYVHRSESRKAVQS